MSLFLPKNLYFRTKHSFMTPFPVSSYFAKHPITLLLEILGGRMRGPSLHLKFFWGTVPQVPLSLRPWETVLKVHGCGDGLCSGDCDARCWWLRSWLSCSQWCRGLLRRGMSRR